MKPLEGKRVLLVEDEYLVAAMAADMLTDLGVAVAGPAGTIAEGSRIAQNEALDAAVLDVNIKGDRSFGIAEVLQARGIPVVFATGYGDKPFERLPGAVTIDKPYLQETLAEVLARALKG